MPKAHFKSNTIFSNPQKLNVDRENGVVNNVCIVNHGPNKNGSYFNNKFLTDLVDKGNSQTQGVKSRFGHPNMCSTSLGTYLGRYKNFRVENNKVFADLHLDEISKKTQVEGKGISMHEYVLDMATSNPDMFGNSIHINSETFDEQVEDKVYTSHILESFIASDLVDDPAATEGLFDFNDLGVAVTNFLDTNPQVFEAIQKDPLIIEDFFDRYIDYLNKFKKDEKMNFLKKLQKKFSTDNTFDVEETTATGDIVTIITEDETPKVGDKVNNADGTAVEDGDLVLKDGSVLVIVDGAISDMKDAETDPPAGDDEEPTMSEVMQAVNGLATTFSAFQKQYKKDLKENQDSIELVATTFEKKFNTLAKSVTSKSPDYQTDPQKKKKRFASDYDPDKVREQREARKTPKNK